jgi:hypothetical protein
MHTPVQIESIAGRWRDNRRGVLEVRVTAEDMAEIVVHQPGHFDQPPTTTRIVMAGAHLTDVIGQLRTVADQLETAMGDTRREAIA